MKPLFLFCFGVSLLAQEASPGWHRFGERTDGQPPVAQAPQPSQAQQPQGGFSSSMPQGQAAPQPQAVFPAPAPAPSYQQPPAYTQGPVNLTVAPGTWITARVNDVISSDHAQPGDAFMATLAQPIVVNGLVVARRGQTVQGRVVQSVRAGRVKGTSSLALELTELSLVDGQQITLKTQMIERRGDTSVGSDLGAIGITSGIGAAIGAAAGGGWGAGIGALAGAAAGTTGVLSTRGRDTVFFPEQVLTFRLEAPVHVYSQAAAAFQPGSASEYDHQLRASQAPAARPAYSAYPVYPAYPYYYEPYGAYPFYGGFGFSSYSYPRYYRGYGNGYGHRR